MITVLDCGKAAQINLDGVHYVFLCQCGHFCAGQWSGECCECYYARIKFHLRYRCWIAKEEEAPMTSLR